MLRRHHFAVRSFEGLLNGTAKDQFPLLDSTTPHRPLRYQAKDTYVLLPFHRRRT